MLEGEATLRPRAHEVPEENVTRSINEGSQRRDTHPAMAASRPKSRASFSPPPALSDRGAEVRSEPSHNGPGDGRGFGERTRMRTGQVLLLWGYLKEREIRRAVTCPIYIEYLHQIPPYYSRPIRPHSPEVNGCAAFPADRSSLLEAAPSHRAQFRLVRDRHASQSLEGSDHSDLAFDLPLIP